MNTNADLLKELRIDRSRPPPSRKGLWITLAPCRRVVLALVAWLLLGRDKPVRVQTATADRWPPATPRSVLDASGYGGAAHGHRLGQDDRPGAEVLIGKACGSRPDRMATLDPIDPTPRATCRPQLAAARSQTDSVRS